MADKQCGWMDGYFKLKNKIIIIHCLSLLNQAPGHVIGGISAIAAEVKNSINCLTQFVSAAQSLHVRQKESSPSCPVWSRDGGHSRAFVFQFKSSAIPLVSSGLCWILRSSVRSSLWVPSHEANTDSLVSCGDYKTSPERSQKSSSKPQPHIPTETLSGGQLQT